MERGSVTRSGIDGLEAFESFDDVNCGGELRLTEPRSNSNLQPQRGCSIQPSVGRRSRATLGERAKMKTTLKELWLRRADEKRWRATAVQDAGALTTTPEMREASWSAPALWRFGWRG
jgi:hypothetical protein